MSENRNQFESSGLPSLDILLKGIHPGDTIVWRIDSLHEYEPFVEALYKNAIKQSRQVVYFKFGSCPSLLKKSDGADVVVTRPEEGFEHFITEIHRKIKDTKGEAVFIFDCLSELSPYCYSDRMIGNFFILTARYLHDLKALGYFSRYRYYHSHHASTPISETAQILIDVYTYKKTIYIKPDKVEGRTSPEMFMLHEWDGNSFSPVKESAQISSVITSRPFPGLRSASYRMIGVWDRLFMRAEAVMESSQKKQASEEAKMRVFRDIINNIVSRDEKISQLAETYFELEDVIAIWKRMIGTGMIGGKSVGMLLAQSILKKHDKRWNEILEEHDSFFIGSDVFYTFLVVNDCWWARQRQKNPDTFLDGNEEVLHRILEGEFPEYIVIRFMDLLDYFGEAPIIVRSSSLLEDNFGNAFAGKYESVFLANQGNREERLEHFLDAVRVIYASSMSDQALNYRKHRGVLDKDEQMALLVQRVSGISYSDFFFPELAGVGFSFNPYAWNKEINPDTGMIRLVFGLGTRAVERADDDYTRVVALNAPELRPEANFDEVKRFAQRRVDVLNLSSNRFENVHFIDVVKKAKELPINLFARRDTRLEEYAREQGLKNVCPWVLTFEKLFKDTHFVSDMREMLKILKDAYGTNVDIEFTTNFLKDGSYKINLVQCRPLQVQEIGREIVSLPALKKQDIILKAEGAVIGNSRRIPVDRVIYVVPNEYGKLPERKRYAVARLIGKLTDKRTRNAEHILLIGPGRWGTSTASLGIPVSSTEINTVSVICEIDAMHEGLTPDLSLGTHFFNEMVELNMLYIAFFVGRKENFMKENFFMNSPNMIKSYLNDGDEWRDIIKVIEISQHGNGKKLYLNANSLEQWAVTYLAD